MKLIAILAIVAVIFGNRAKATTPAGESENTNPGKITSIPNANSTTTKRTTNTTTTPKPTPTTSTTNGTNTPKPTPTNGTTNGTNTPKPTPTNSTTNGTNTPKPTPTNSTTNGTTTPKPTPTNSTTNGTTTPKPTPTNSTTNGTTTPKPTPTNSTSNGTTTPKPTPTNSTTNGSTTLKPSTAAPTTPPPYGEFSLRENGSYCILAHFVAEFSITFEVNSTSGNTSKIKNQTLSESLNRSSNVIVTGNCDSKNGSTLVISWPKNESHYTLTMEFMSTLGNNDWFLSSLTFNISVDKIKKFANSTVKGNVSSTYKGNQETSPHGQAGGNYRCKDAVAFVFDNSETLFEVKSTFMDFRVQPFAHASKEDGFSTNVTECKQDSTTTAGPTTPKPSDVIPIAVGCALAGLVLIVLIAYVIGRRKSHSGYEKV